MEKEAEVAVERAEAWRKAAAVGVKLATKENSQEEMTGVLAPVAKLKQRGENVEEAERKQQQQRTRILVSERVGWGPVVPMKPVVLNALSPITRYCMVCVHRVGCVITTVLPDFFFRTLSADLSPLVNFRRMFRYSRLALSARSFFFRASLQ